MWLPFLLLMWHFTLIGCECWTTLVTLGWFQLDHCGHLFNVFFGFSLLIFLEDFSIHIHQRSWPMIFCWYICLIFRVIVASIDWFGEYSSSLVFWLLEKDCYKFFFSLSTYSISLLMISRFKLHISSWFSFGGLYVNISRKLSIYSRLSSLSAGLFVAFSYGLFFFNFCIMCCYFSSFISDFVWVLSFSLGEPGQRLMSLMLILWKNQVLVVFFF